MLRSGPIRRFALTSLLALMSTPAGSLADNQIDGNTDGIQFFEKRIRPVLVAKCYACHSETVATQRKLKGNLLLDSKAGILSGGESGAVIVVNKPDQSLLIKAIRHDEIEMPPKEQLPKSVIEDFEKWIAMGAPDPRVGKTSNARTLDLESGRQHWAFRRLTTPAPPNVSDPLWNINPLDRFVYEKLGKQRLSPSRMAARRTLARRLYFDLIGLPPTPRQVDAFINDRSELAYEKLVDQLLESQHYGERWARHWLDVVRFGESEGSNPEEDKLRRESYRYRDAVIRAFNEDLPFSDFTSYQIAGVSLNREWQHGHDLARFVDLGTRLQRNTHPNDRKYHILDDMVSTTGSAFLGLTVGCARCHDHKIDPITSEEYYRLTAVFFDRVNVVTRVGSNDHQALRKPHLLAGGNWQRPVRKVNPGFIQVLMQPNRRSEDWHKTPADNESKVRTATQSPRESMVAWMIDVENGAGGLLARVIVNRIWQHHFGRGIVTTPNDFGHLGARPTHPKLLDWLASEFIRKGWRLKPIHRLILTSRTYRQAPSNQWASVDRDNKWLWHYQTRRLEAEAIRDNILSASGSLNARMFGPSIEIGSAKRVYVEKPEHWRRSIYLMNPRFHSHPVLEMFDPPESFRSTGVRDVSTTPASALFVFNAPFLWKQAELLAKRVSAEAGPKLESRINLLYEIAFARQPTNEEQHLGVAFLKAMPSADSKIKPSRLVQYCHTIMGLNEFIYVR